MSAVMQTRPVSTQRAPAPATVAGPVTQVRVARAEWTKLRALRSAWWCALIAVVLIIGLGAAIAGSGAPYKISAGNSAAGGVAVSLAGVVIAQLVLGVLGVLAFSGEYATGMIRATLAVVPSRLPVLWAKLIVLVGLVLPLSLLAAVTEFFTATALESSRGGSAISLTDPGVLREVVGAALYLAIIAVIGLALGALLRRTAAGLSVFAARVLRGTHRHGLPSAQHQGVRALPAVQRRRGHLGGREAVRRGTAESVGRIRGAVRLRGRADRLGRLAAAPPRRLNTRKGREETSRSFRTPVENPGTRPPCSRAFDVGVRPARRRGVVRDLSFAQTAHPAHPPLAVSLVVAVLTALVQPLRRSGPARYSPSAFSDGAPIWRRAPLALPRPYHSGKVSMLLFAPSALDPASGTRIWKKVIGRTKAEVQDEQASPVRISCARAVITPSRFAHPWRGTGARRSASRQAGKPKSDPAASRTDAVST